MKAYFSPSPIVATMILAVSSLCFSSCNDLSKAKGAAEVGVKSFHLQYNAGKYFEIYRDTNADFKVASTEYDFVRMLSVVDSKLGKEITSNQKNWQVNSLSDKTLAILTQETSFERGEATETFTFIISDNNCRLKGYRINPHK